MKKLLVLSVLTAMTVNLYGAFIDTGKMVRVSELSGLNLNAMEKYEFEKMLTGAFYGSGDTQDFVLRKARIVSAINDSTPNDFMAKMKVIAAGTDAQLDAMGYKGF
jgi:hypothetical protein